MIKDKIITMDNEKEYYVLDDIIYEGRNFIISIECNLKKDEVNEKDYHIMELTIENNKLAIKKILDEELAKVVTMRLIEKVRNSEE